MFIVVVSEHSFSFRHLTHFHLEKYVRKMNWVAYLKMLLG
jgi:hypothetical protein